ncbi:hypothetical protein CBS147345_10812 [Aspergillus niger]|nr:hypothetical protein CBS133816_4704 [Aspergillus niger]KAI2987684.1 hypothetical protein CBS147345_10812 [Aspergillus niger]
MSSPRIAPYANEEYTVGWICALPVELAAARGMLDGEDHGEPQTSPAAADQNRYTLGTIGHFRVVIACLPKNQLGSSSATASVKDMLFTFPNIRIGLCVGIGAGIPDYESQDEQDVRLGDVVISSDSKTGGVVAYALGKKLADGSFETRSALAPPPRSLSTALGAMQAQHMMEEHKIGVFVDQMLDKHPFMRKKGYSRPDQSLDRLFRSGYIHAAGKNCSKCDVLETVERDDRFDDAPVIHYGTIASGDIVVKNAALRDEIRDKHGAICLEMEAAGLMNNFPCVVIRGISDYADSHKNDRWQPYAAAVAAACAKEYLEHVQVKDVSGEPTAKALFEKVQEVHSEVTKVGRFVTTRETREVLDWVSSIDFVDQQNDIISLRQDGTGHWLINSEEFIQWMSDDIQPRTLFCPGIPGAGKTIMASIVVEYLKNTFKGDSNVKVAFQFCSYQPKHGQTYLELLQSLVRQLALKTPDADLLPCILQLHQDHSSNSTRPRPTELEKTILEAIESYSMVFLVVDALDEFYSASREDSLLFFDALCKIRESPQVKLFVTSRYNDDISSRFAPCISREIRAHEDDVLQYVKERMPQLRIPKTTQTAELRNEIQSEVVRTVDGVFLLAKLHMNHLMGFLTVRQMKNALVQLPRGTTGLELAYNQAMLRITSQGDSNQGVSDDDDSQSKVALRALSWLSFSKTALTADQLVHAIGTKPGMKDPDRENLMDPNTIDSLCAGLVAFDRNTGIIRLVHHTTKAYLLKSSHLQDGEVEIAKITLTYLSFDSFSTGRCSHESSFVQREERYPLFTYCALYWGAHLSPLLEKSSDLLRLTLQFLKLDTNVRASGQALILGVYNYFKRTLMGETPIPWSHSFLLTKVHLACYFNLHTIIDHYISQNVELNIVDSTGKVPILWAIEQGHIETTQILLKSDCVDICFKDHEGKTLLMHATIAQHAQLAELLILHGAFCDARDNKGRSALAYAATTGQIAMIQLLISHNVQLNFTHDAKAVKPVGADDMFTSLFDVADALEEDGPVFLLDEIVDPVGTPLINAISTGHREAAILLLENGADPNYANSEGDTPLSAAVARRNEDLVKILLDRGATLEESPSTLYYAIENGDLGIVRRFLEAGADPNCEYSPTSLQRSNPWVTSMEPVTAEELSALFMNLGKSLVTGVNTSNLPILTETGLSRATRLGHAEVVLELLKHGADPNQQDGKKETPLFVASKNGHTEIVRVLLANGANPNIQNKYHQTALFPASRWAKPLIVTLFLDAGLSVNLPDISGSTPLFYAVESGSEEVVKLLLSKGADVGQLNAMFETALFGATKYANPELCQLLLAEGADPEQMNLLQCTPLFNIANGICTSRGSAPQQLYPGSHDFDASVKAAILLIENGANPCPQVFDPEVEEVHEVLQAYIANFSQPIRPADKSPEFTLFAREIWGDFLKSLTDEDVYTFLELLCMGRSGNIEPCEKGPLYWVSVSGSCELVSKVLQTNVDIEAKNSGFLQGAVESGNADVTDMVLNALGKETISSQSTAALFEASAERGNLDVVKALFSRIPANPDIGKAVIAAVWSGSTELVDFFLTNVDDPLLVDGKDMNVFHHAVVAKSYAMLQFLLDQEPLRKLNINAKGHLGFSPLLCVTQMRHNNTEFARLLLQRGADPNSTESPRPDTQESMSQCESNNQLENSTEALDEDNLRARENWDHWVLLAFAAHNGADDLVELLLEYHADPDPINQYGVRPICLAALDGHEAVVRMLLDKKVDPNQVEGSSKAPLSWALERHLDAYRYSPSRISDWPGSQAVQATVKLLLERGADPNPGDGTSPILAALRLYSEELVLLLLKAGSSPHVRDVYGRTPLIIATALGMTRVVAALLEIPDEWTSPVITDVYGRFQEIINQKCGLQGGPIPKKIKPEFYEFLLFV